MDQKFFTVLTAIALTASAASAAAAQDVVETGKETTTRTTTTTTVVTETVTTKETTKKPEWKPFKVCVLDFNIIDIFGQQRFLDVKNKPIVIPPQSMLDDADHRSISPYMQGYVRMMDASDVSNTNRANRAVQIEDDVFTRQKALAIYDTVMNGPSRPMVIGAEYLSAYLGKHNDVFSCLDISQVATAMKDIQDQPDFPKDFMLRIAKETGATHLIYGTVSDLRSKTNSFSGYGIQTNTTTYQLDVIIKMIDLAAQSSVYSNVYTGTYREQLPVSTEQFDNDIFQSLMKSALEQAAEDLYDACREGRKNKITVTPMPWLVTVKPVGNDLVPSHVAVFADGILVGAGGEMFPLVEGTHQIEVHADGYIAKAFKLNVKSDMTVSITMEQKEKPQPKVDPEAEPELELIVSSEKKVEAAVVAEPGTVVKVEAEQMAEPEAEPGTVVETEADAETADAEPEAPVEAEPETEVETEAETVEAEPEAVEEETVVGIDSGESSENEEKNSDKKKKILKTKTRNNKQ